MAEKKEIRGLTRLQRKMAKIVAAEKNDLDRALMRAAMLIAGDAQRRVTGGGASTTMLNVRTGRLRRGIRAVKVRHRIAKVTTSRVVYAPIHEFGGKAGRGRKVSIPARPYIRPAFAAKKDEAFQIIRAVWSNILHGAGEIRIEFGRP